MVYPDIINKGGTDMSKKIASISIVMALVISLIANSTVLAATFSDRYGKVTSVSSSSYTIKNFSGKSKTIDVTSSTHFYGVNGRSRSLGYLTPGMWVFASGTNASNGTLKANNVVITGPLNTGKSFWNFPREFGTVISVNSASGVFFMNTAKSGQVKVIVYSGTTYRSSIKKVSNIHPGMKALVAGPIQSNGFILARIIVVFNP